MSLSDLPDIPVFIEALPEALAKLVEESTERFRTQFPAYLRPIAEAQGWTEQYRTEIKRVIRETLKEAPSCLEQSKR